MEALRASLLDKIKRCEDQLLEAEEALKYV